MKTERKMNEREVEEKRRHGFGGWWEGTPPCRSVDCYRKIAKIEEGQYGVVYKAQDKETGEIVALKKVKPIATLDEGFPITSLREIRAMMLQGRGHPNIVQVREVVASAPKQRAQVDAAGRTRAGATGTGTGTEAEAEAEAEATGTPTVYIVMEYLDHDLKSLLATPRGRFLQSEVKCLVQQLLTAVAYMHDACWLVHRDLKTSNLLYSNDGHLKVADFGLARLYTAAAGALGRMTPLVVTLWYRAPELLLGEPCYTPAVDVWSVGCIFAEIVLRAPLFAGRSEAEQLRLVFDALGAPTAGGCWPGYAQLPLARARGAPAARGCAPGISPRFLARFRGALTQSGVDLLLRMLAYDPARRITAAAALRHPYFADEPLPRDIALMPTWPSTHAFERARRDHSPPANPLLVAQDLARAAAASAPPAKQPRCDPTILDSNSESDDDGYEYVKSP